MVRRLGILTTAFVLVLAACGSDDDEASTTTTTTTTAPTTTPAATDDPPIWPASDVDPFATPDDAAIAFARDFLGMPDASLGEPTGTDDRVAIRPYDERGPSTIVEVAEREGGWVVTGATTEEIVVTEPTPEAPLTNPLVVSGESTAFEGTINLEVRLVGDTEAIASGFATGGANGVMGPFETTLELTTEESHVVLTVFAPDASGDAEMLAATVLLLG